MINKFTIILLLFSYDVYAKNQDYYCNDLDLGWNFYCDPKLKKPSKEKSNKATSKEIQTAESDPVEQLDKIRKKLESLKAAAIVNPTKENVTAYLKYQKEQLDRSSVFADQYQRVTWQNSDLNYLLKRPTGTVAKQTWQANRETEIATNLKENISENYGLFFFFRSDCVYCHAYAPIIKRFIERENITLMAISLDNKPISGFENFRKDSGQAKKLGINATPATVLFNKKTGEVTTVGFGLITEDELAERMYLLTKIEVGNDF